MRKFLTIFITSAIFISLQAAPAQAIILFQDDFSSGNLNNWTVEGFDIPLAGVSNILPNESDGNYAYLTGWAFGRFAGLNTTVDTTGYSNLNLSFDARTFAFENTSNDIFSVLYRGNDGLWFNQDITPGDWQNYSINLDESVWGNNVEIAFLLQSEGNGPVGGLLDLDWGKFDNVALSAAGNGSNAVPEPASMILLGSGLLGMVGLRNRKKS